MVSWNSIYDNMNTFFVKNKDFSYKSQSDTGRNGVSIFNSCPIEVKHIKTDVLFFQGKTGEVF